MSKLKKVAMALGIATLISAQAHANDGPSQNLAVTPAAVFSQAEIQAMFEQGSTPLQLAALSQREMRETEGEWIPFAFYYYGPAIAGGVSWLATSGWRTIPSVWNNSRQRFSRLF
jgi:hypothetical protein